MTPGEAAVRAATDTIRQIVEAPAPFDTNCRILQRALSKYGNAWLYPDVKNYREDMAAFVVTAARRLVEQHDEVTP